MRRPTGLVIGRPLGRIHAHTDKTVRQTRHILLRYDPALFFFSFFFHPSDNNERTNKREQKRKKEKEKKNYLITDLCIFPRGSSFLPHILFFFQKKKSNPELTNKGEVEHLEGPIKRKKPFPNQQTTQFKFCLKEEACYASPSPRTHISLNNHHLEYREGNKKKKSCITRTCLIQSSRPPSSPLWADDNERLKRWFASSW